MASPLVDILVDLDPEMILSDGGSDWSVENLIDALNGADQEDTADYVADQTSDGRLQIHRIRSDGFMDSVASYTERRKD